MIDHIHDRIGEIRSRITGGANAPLGQTASPEAFTGMLQSALSSGATYGTQGLGATSLGAPSLGATGATSLGATSATGLLASLGFGSLTSIGGSPLGGVGTGALGGGYPVARTGEITGPVPDAATPYLGLFEQAGERYGVDPSLLAAVAWTESGFRPDAVSSAGALGLMQIMPATAAGLGVDPRDPAQAVDGAARYLRDQLDAFGGDTRLAVAAYNAGPGAVSRHGGIPPYPETIAYVQKVMARHAQLGGVQ